MYRVLRILNHNVCVVFENMYTLNVMRVLRTPISIHAHIVSCYVYVVTIELHVLMNLLERYNNMDTSNYYGYRTLSKMLQAYYSMSHIKNKRLQSVFTYATGQSFFNGCT